MSRFPLTVAHPDGTTCEEYLVKCDNETSLPLPPRLLRNLLELARKYQDDGLTLLVFGSFARGDQRPTSDLDLGVEWHGKRRPEIFLRLYWDVQELPTIRKIELVDFEQTDSDFRRVAGLDKIYLVERRGAQ